MPIRSFHCCLTGGWFTSDLPVEIVATEAGFGTATAMRQHFQRHIGVPPSTYRRMFHATLAS